MPSQRVVLGTGLAILLVISAASIGLEVKSRSDAAWVDHTLGVLQKLSDLRLLIRSAESAARGFALSNDPNFIREYRESSNQIEPALADLIEETRDNPVQTQLLESNRQLIARRLAVSAELARLQAAGDSSGIAALTARAEGRSVMDTIGVNFDKLVAEEDKLLAIRTADSRRTRIVLLGIDLAGALLILMLAAILIQEVRRSSRKLETSLDASRAENESLEAAVAERTEHLLAAHEELRRSASVMQSTFNSMAEAVLVIDTTGAVVLSNAAAEQMLRYRTGMTIEQVRSTSVAYHADGTTPILPNELPAARALRGEHVDSKEVVARPLRGAAPLHLVISARPLRDASGAISGAAVVYHNISAARETERLLQQAQKLDAIGKLTGGVAHDFNNMLTVITGTTETLVAALARQPELQSVAKLIDDAAERCSELIQHLLAFARRQPLQPRNVDINGAVVDIAKLLRPTLGEQIEIETILEPEATVSHIDASQLANSVLNMAINARDAMPRGGKLLLETRNVVLDEAYAQTNVEVRPGPYVMLAVSDTGAGMPADVRDKAFEPFFTTKEVGKGSGLGLSMVYGFVKQSGGHIKIYSEEGHGTTIRLYLPPARGSADTAKSAATPVAGGNETILVVEDDSLVRNFVIAQLHALGYKTLAAADSRAALAHVENGEPFDLLFTDVIMPGGMTGRQLADEVTKHRPDMKVLYTSGYTDNAIVHHGRLDEGVLLLTKPYRKAQLAQMVRRALRGETS
ncbi:CHASE3 domain-containing protein [Bradyrhizobium canariense]|uniref:histidine kinase n=1 Tax=Bradyrhizobium canariense TaxID=255045 RepID=A0A1H1R5E7_9BRAD|nr:CHASE3 domain-containing protein [Bradyrhizobium canariense]SDS31024.1 Signal transduction histidine kinase [Bradyrhizobium canariense]